MPSTLGFHIEIDVDFEFDSPKLSGFSVSGLATWMIAPEFDVCFDMGECPLTAVAINHVFLTHAHGDHSRCLMRHYALRKMMGIEREATYYLPKDILESAQEAEKIILLSGDGDFDILVKRLIERYGCIVDVYGVKELTAVSLINSASKFYPITEKFLM